MQRQADILIHPSSRKMKNACLKLLLSYSLHCFWFVADVDECKEKVACQCSECKCKNTWGSYECNCGSGLLYMQEHDTCISKFLELYFNHYRSLEKLLFMMHAWSVKCFTWFVFAGFLSLYCLGELSQVKMLKLKLAGASSGSSSWVWQLLELQVMQFTSTESGYDSSTLS